MQQVFETFEKFSQSSFCIFNYKSLDYPTFFQQHLIVNYFQLSNILRDNQHPEIVRLLHSSNDKQFEMFLPGLLYHILLDVSNGIPLFDKYMPILRNQSWISLDKLLQSFIKECFLIIKPQFKNSLSIILYKLMEYGQLSQHLLILTIKSIDIFDLSENSLNYNNSILDFFHHMSNIHFQDNSLKKLLSANFFYKILRILTFTTLVDQETTKQYHQKCIKLAYKLYQIDNQSCLSIGLPLLNLINQLRQESKLQRLFQSCKDHLKTKAHLGNNCFNLDIKLSLVLPLRIQNTLIFIIKEQISQLEVKMQLDWAFSNAPDHFQFIIIDILKYLLSLSHQQLPQNQSLYILQWLHCRSCSNNILSQLWYGQLFSPCFIQNSPYIAGPQRALRFLNYLFQSNFRFGEKLLLYLLRQIHNPSYSKRLHQILLEADSLQILKISKILNNEKLSMMTNKGLRAALGESDQHHKKPAKEYEKFYEHHEDEMQRKQSQMSIQFSDSQSSQNYQEELPEFNKSPLIEAQEQQAIQELKVYKIKLQKIFAQDIGQNLIILLNDPCLLNFKQFYKLLLDHIKTFKVNGQQQIIQIFIREAAKLTYVLFQSQFQNYKASVLKDQHVGLFLLQIVFNQWRTNSLLGQITKKIMKKIIDMFPTVEPSFWKIFLMNFRRNTHPQAKQVKQWLMTKEKSDYVVTILRQFGLLNRDLLQNAQQFKLPYAC